ncbi:hypothetical protein J6590_048592 [Homalodisca vitripennis]|nr:hypothetical protein J6590_048592 [Homalodisca vitripennis]
MYIRSPAKVGRMEPVESHGIYANVVCGRAEGGNATFTVNGPGSLIGECGTNGTVRINISSVNCRDMLMGPLRRCATPLVMDVAQIGDNSSSLSFTEVVKSTDSFEFGWSSDSLYVNQLVIEGTCFLLKLAALLASLHAEASQCRQPVGVKRRAVNHLPFTD